MNNKKIILDTLEKKLKGIHIVSECLSDTERDYHESKQLMENKLREAGLFVPAWNLYIKRTYGTKGFHVVGNKYYGDYMLKDMDLSGMDLSGMDFSHVHFQNCDLSYCNLSNTNFDGVCLDFTNITGVNIRNANFSNVCYSGVKSYPLKLNAYGANLEHSYFSYVDLSKSDFQYASLRNVYMSGCTLNNVKFMYADLTNALLYYADLCNVNFTNAILDSADFEKATIAGHTDLDKAKSARNVNIESAVVQTGGSITSYRELISLVLIGLLILAVIVYDYVK